MTQQKRVRLERSVRMEQLLDAAEQAFAEQGYSATSIEHLAQSAGVSRPVIYDHFGSKDGIYLACLRRARQLLDESVITAVLAVTDLEERLIAGIDATFAFIEENPARWAAVYNGVAVAGPVAEEAWRLRLATVDQIAAMIEDAVPDIPRRRIESYAHALSGAVEQTERWWRNTPDLTRAEAVRNLAEFAWRGLRHLVDEQQALPDGDGDVTDEPGRPAPSSTS